jgi:prophage regulatory protein
MTSLLRLPSVINATGLSRSGIYAYIADGLLPKPVKIGERSTAWPECEVSAVNAARIAGKSENEIRQLVANLHEQRTLAA